MNFATNLNRINRGILVVVMLMVVFFAADVMAATFVIYGFVYNSDGSVPETGDITITAYLQKNPSNTYVFANVRNVDESGFSFEMEAMAGWSYDVNGGSSLTTAYPGDVVVLEFENTNSGSPYFGETGQLSEALITSPPNNQQFGPNDYSLPVELSSFNAKVQDDAIVLTWVTQAELENLGFYVYRSVDGSEFQQLNARMVEGAGTVTSRNEYEYRDEYLPRGSVFMYRLESVDINGQVHKHQAITVNMDDAAVAADYTLSQNYPNPFNPVTTIQYNLGQDAQARLSIYNVIGNLVTELVNEYQPAGAYSYQWAGLDAKNNKVPSGLYFYRLEAGSTTLVRKMVLSK